MGDYAIPHFFDSGATRLKKDVMTQIPRHVAIIMDGNGRWAAKKRLPRFSGHLEGVRRVEEIVREAGEAGIRVLTLFVFSTENWKRPPHEVSRLMQTLCSVLDKKLDGLMKAGVKLRVIGQSENVPDNVARCLRKAQEKTAQNSGLILNLAFNYGGRAEILDAVKKIIRKGLAPEEINEERFRECLYTHDLPDPDLLIRTSGEMRISNFLLWQLSYAELYFTEKYWPEFDAHEFRRAIDNYQIRERRYGKISF